MPLGIVRSLTKEAMLLDDRLFVGQGANTFIAARPS
jgi:hypothetical protein